MRESSDGLIGMDIRVVARAEESHQRRVIFSALEQKTGYHRAVLHILRAATHGVADCRLC